MPNQDEDCENLSESSIEHHDEISTTTSNYRMARIDKWLENSNTHNVSLIDNESNIPPSAVLKKHQTT